MKEKIIELLENTVGISPSGLSLMNLDAAADEISQMMSDMYVHQLYEHVRGMESLHDFKEVCLKWDREWDYGFNPEQIQKSLEKLTT